MGLPPVQNDAGETLSIQTVSLLFVSNGHGEDTVGAALAAHVQSLAGSRARIVAWPIVGRGGPYASAGISLIGPRGELPSGGFGYLSPASQLRDMVSGGITLVLRQLAFAWRHRKSFDAVVGVGDRVSLELNHYILKKPMVWVAIADTVRYLPPGREAGTPRMRKAMRTSSCRSVFVRDVETRDSLNRLGIAAEYVGNPMMDLVDRAAQGSVPDRSRLDHALRVAGVPAEGPLVVLLPGSRDDAYLNLPDQLEAYRYLAELSGGSVRAAVAWAPGLDMQELSERLSAVGWRLESSVETPGVGGARAVWMGSGDPTEDVLRPVNPGTITPHPVPLLVGFFGNLLRAADAVIGQAGTAVEQAAGLGRPVIAFPGRGSQATPRFLRGQKQMLGEAIMITEPAPEQVARAVLSVLSDPDLKERMAAAGRERMGPPGALAVIARRIVEELIP